MNVKKYNFEAFTELILRYESITMEEITEVYKTIMADYPGISTRSLFIEIRENLTSFGTIYCILCRAAEALSDDKCSHCVYSLIYSNVSEDPNFSHATPCIRSDISSPTYCGINDSTSCENLLKAYKKRAEFMRGVLKMIEEKPNEKQD